MHRFTPSRLVLFTLAACSFVACTPPSVQDCARTLSAPQVLVQADVDEPRIVRRESSSELGRMLGARAGGARALGLTEATPSYSVQVDVESRMHSEGGVCAVPLVTVRLRYKDVRIGIAREIAPDSCRYHETLAHEERHVQAYREHAAFVQARLQQDLTESLEKQGAQLYADESVAQERLAQEVVPRVARLTTKLMSAVSKAHRAIDSVHEYERLAEVCEHEPVFWEDEQPQPDALGAAARPAR